MPTTKRLTKSRSYQNISITLFIIIIIQTIVIIQLYYHITTSCQDNEKLKTVQDTPQQQQPELQHEQLQQQQQQQDVIQTSYCGSLTNIPIGEENAKTLTLTSGDSSSSSSSSSSHLVYPTSGLLLSGDMITNGPVNAIAVRYNNIDILQDKSQDEWIIASVNQEYIKMIKVIIRQDEQQGLSIYTVSSGYINVHSLHSFGNSYHLDYIDTNDLTTSIVKHSWDHKVDQEVHGYELNTFHYCLCNVIDSSLLSRNKFDSVVVHVPLNDAQSVVLTDSKTFLSGSQITNGPVHCQVFRSTNVKANAQKAIWLIAAVNDEYIKIVEVTVSQATSTTLTTTSVDTKGSLSIYISNSGYTIYKEFGTYETDSLTSHVVNAAWNKMIPNNYDVSSISYYTQNDDISSMSLQ